MAEPREIITGRFEWTTEVHAHITRWAEQFLDEYHGRTDAAQTHPLDKSQPEKIRILELLPGRGDERIVCHIRTQPLVSAARFGSTEEYEAVSYVWGDPSRTQSITIETNSPPDSTAGGAVGGTSRELAITHSVYRLLCHLRKSHKPRSLWIDQICIDQENAEEKARQIRRMAEIYSGAVTVIIWLGDVQMLQEHADFFSTSLDLFSLLHNTSDESRGALLTALMTGSIDTYDDSAASPHGYFTADAFAKWKQYVSRGAVPCNESIPMSFDELLIAGMKCFEEFLEGQPWFHRAWTFQESVVSRDAIVVYGAHSRDWDVLVQACRYVASRHHRLDQKSGIKLSPRVQRVIDDVNLRAAYRQDFSYLLIQLQGPSHRLWDQVRESLKSDKDAPERRLRQSRLKALLPLLRPTDATEPVDKVLALTGFAHDDGQKIVFPDQPGDVSLLYLTVVKYWMTTPNDTTYINTAGMHGSAADYLYWDDWPSPLMVKKPDMSFLSHIRFDPENNHNMPTWVPDWSLPLEVVPLSTYPEFRACGDWTEPVRINDTGLIATLGVLGIPLLTLATFSTSLHNTRHFESLNAVKDLAFCTTVSAKYGEALADLLRPIEISQVNSGDPSAAGVHTPPNPDSAQVQNALDGQMRAVSILDASLFEGRLPIVTELGIMGLVPLLAAPGDEIYLLSGTNVPFLLRPTGPRSFIVIGECYVSGLMHGEIMYQFPAERVEVLVLL